MPIKSKAEWGYLFAKKREVAKQMAKDTKMPYGKLPAHVKKKAAKS